MFSHYFAEKEFLQINTSFLRLLGQAIDTRRVLSGSGTFFRD